MTIKQEEESPICDSFDKLKISTAFSLLEEVSTSHSVDSELLKEYILQTISILKDFEKSVCGIEKDLQKKKNKEKFREKLYGNEQYGD